MTDLPASDLQRQWSNTMQQLPLIAILRGVTPDEAIDVASVLIESGFRVMEVPLNSPSPFETIEKMASRFGNDIMVGAGTVLTAEDANRTLDTGAKLIVAPNLSEDVSAVTFQRECVYCPGVATPTEAFQALNLGADGLKLFPAEMIPPSVVKALNAVLPESTLTIPVGGITPDSMADYAKAGAGGFGIGSALYKPGKPLEQLRESADAFVSAYARINSH